VLGGAYCAGSAVIGNDKGPEVLASKPPFQGLPKSYAVMRTEPRSCARVRRDLRG